MSRDIFDFNGDGKLGIIEETAKNDFFLKQESRIRAEAEAKAEAKKLASEPWRRYLTPDKDAKA